MHSSVKKSYKRDFSELEKIFEFLNEFYSDLDADSGIIQALHLTVEELFTNMVKYNPGGPSSITILFDKSAETISIQFTDKQPKPFDITKTEEVDLNAYIKELRSGGLGIHLVKQLMDKIDYDFHDQTSIITVTKNIY